MGTERKAVVALISALLSLPCAPRVPALCWVSYELERGGWSQAKRVEIEFFATRELYPDAREYPVYARIWFSRSQPLLALLYGQSLATPTLPPSHLKRLFPDDRWVYAIDDPQRWRIRCRENRQWVDPRLADLIEPPPPVFPSQRSY